MTHEAIIVLFSPLFPQGTIVSGHHEVTCDLHLCPATSTDWPSVCRLCSLYLDNDDLGYVILAFSTCRHLTAWFFIWLTAWHVHMRLSMCDWHSNCMVEQVQIWTASTRSNTIMSEINCFSWLKIVDFHDWNSWIFTWQLGDLEATCCQGLRGAATWNSDSYNGLGD